MEIKTFFCKQCKFTGNRPMVRKHIRENHLTTGLRSGKTIFGERNDPSPITKIMGVSK